MVAPKPCAHELLLGEAKFTIEQKDEQIRRLETLVWDHHAAEVAEQNLLQWMHVTQESLPPDVQHAPRTCIACSDDDIVPPGIREISQYEYRAIPLQVLKVWLQNYVFVSLRDHRPVFTEKSIWECSCPSFIGAGTAEDYIKHLETVLSIPYTKF